MTDRPEGGAATAWARGREVLARGGVRRLLALLARRALAPLARWRTLHFYERDLTRPAPPFEARVPVEARVAARGDLETHRAALLASGARWEDIEERLGRGDLCFVGVTEGRLAHFMWLALRPSPIPAIGVTVAIERGEGLVYSSYTDPVLRGRAVQPAVANAMIKHEQSLGLARHFYYVLAGNDAGRRIVTGRHAPAPAVTTRTVTCVHVPLLRGVLLRGIDAPGRPALTVAPPGRARRLGRLGVWVSGVAVDLGSL